MGFVNNNIYRLKVHEAYQLVMVVGSGTDMDSYLDHNYYRNSFMGNQQMNISTRELVEEAKQNYPVSVHYKGRLTEEELSEIEKECDVKSASVYMDGSAMYSIRYRRISSGMDTSERENAQ